MTRAYPLRPTSRASGRCYPRRVADRGFTVLRTPRLLLRRFQPGDLDAFVAYRADPEVARYQGWEAGYSRAQGEALIEWVTSVDPDTPGQWYQFAIERREAPGLIGDCAARFDDDAVEVGFTLAPAHQGQGTPPRPSNGCSDTRGRAGTGRPLPGATSRTWPVNGCWVGFGSRSRRRSTASTGTPGCS